MYFNEKTRGYLSLMPCALTEGNSDAVTTTETTKVSDVNLSECVTTAVTMCNDNSDYIQAKLGSILTKCLKDVVEVRPYDPIDYIARWLYAHGDNIMYYYEKKMRLLRTELVALKILTRNKNRKNFIKQTKDRLEIIKLQLKVIESVLREMYLSEKRQPEPNYLVRDKQALAVSKTRRQKDTTLLKKLLTSAHKEDISICSASLTSDDTVPPIPIQNYEPQSHDGFYSDLTWIGGETMKESDVVLDAFVKTAEGVEEDRSDESKSWYARDSTEEDPDGDYGEDFDLFDDKTELGRYELKKSLLNTKIKYAVQVEQALQSGLEVSEEHLTLYNEAIKDLKDACTLPQLQLKYSELLELFTDLKDSVGDEDAATSVVSRAEALDTRIEIHEDSSMPRTFRRNPKKFEKIKEWVSQQKPQYHGLQLDMETDISLRQNLQQSLIRSNAPSFGLKTSPFSQEESSKSLTSSSEEDLSARQQHTPALSDMSPEQYSDEDPAVKTAVPEKGTMKTRPPTFRRVKNVRDKTKVNHVLLTDNRMKKKGVSTKKARKKMLTQITHVLLEEHEDESSEDEIDQLEKDSDSLSEGEQNNLYLQDKTVQKSVLPALEEGKDRQPRSANIKLEKGRERGADYGGPRRNVQAKKKKKTKSYLREKLQTSKSEDHSIHEVSSVETNVDHETESVEETAEEFIQHLDIANPYRSNDFIRGSKKAHYWKGERHKFSQDDNEDSEDIYARRSLHGDHDSFEHDRINKDITYRKKSKESYLQKRPKDSKPFKAIKKRERFISGNESQTKFNSLDEAEQEADAGLSKMYPHGEKNRRGKILSSQVDSDLSVEDTEQTRKKSASGKVWREMDKLPKNNDLQNGLDVLKRKQASQQVKKRVGILRREGDSQGEYEHQFDENETYESIEKAVKLLSGRDPSQKGKRRASKLQSRGESVMETNVPLSEIDHQSGSLEQRTSDAERLPSTSDPSLQKQKKRERLQKTRKTADHTNRIPQTKLGENDDVQEIGTFSRSKSRKTSANDFDVPELFKSFEPLSDWKERHNDEIRRPVSTDTSGTSTPKDRPSKAKGHTSKKIAPVIYPATWKISNRFQLVCQHPTLGDMVPRPPIMPRETPEWWREQRFDWRSLYDHEVYSRHDDDEVRGFYPENPSLTAKDFIFPGPWIYRNNALVPDVAKEQYTMSPDYFHHVRFIRGGNDRGSQMEIFTIKAVWPPLRPLSNTPQSLQSLPDFNTMRTRSGNKLKDRIEKKSSKIMYTVPEHTSATLNRNTNTWRHRMEFLDCLEHIHGKRTNFLYRGKNLNISGPDNREQNPRLCGRSRAQHGQLKGITMLQSLAQDLRDTECEFKILIPRVDKVSQHQLPAADSYLPAMMKTKEDSSDIFQGKVSRRRFGKNAIAASHHKLGLKGQQFKNSRLNSSLRCTKQPQETNNSTFLVRTKTILNEETTRRMTATGMSKDTNSNKRPLRSDKDCINRPAKCLASSRRNILGTIKNKSKRTENQICSMKQRKDVCNNSKNDFSHTAWQECSKPEKHSVTRTAKTHLSRIDICKRSSKTKSLLFDKITQSTEVKTDAASRDNELISNNCLRRRNSQGSRIFGEKQIFSQNFNFSLTESSYEKPIEVDASKAHTTEGNKIVQSFTQDNKRRITKPHNFTTEKVKFSPTLGQTKRYKHAKRDSHVSRIKIPAAHTSTKSTDTQRGKNINNNKLVSTNDKYSVDCQHVYFCIITKTLSSIDNRVTLGQLPRLSFEWISFKSSKQLDSSLQRKRALRNVETSERDRSSQLHLNTIMSHHTTLRNGEVTDYCKCLTELVSEDIKALNSEDIQIALPGTAGGTQLENLKREIISTTVEDNESQKSCYEVKPGRNKKRALLDVSTRPPRIKSQREEHQLQSREVLNKRTLSKIVEILNEALYSELKLLLSSMGQTATSNINDSWNSWIQK